jgi:importin subunit beta-1
LLKQLSDVLKHAGNSPVARMQAGLQLKNALYSKDANIKAEYSQRWLQFPEDTRTYIKQNVS